MRKTQLIFLFTSLFLFSTTCTLSASTIVFDLKCENLVKPNAIDNTTPHFSWKLKSEKGKLFQHYYEIQVASDSTSLTAGKANLWSTGKVKSSASVMVPYKGKLLFSQSLCYWRVRVWDENGKASDWSPISRFGIGILDNDMKGSYIGLSGESGDVGCPILRKEFVVDNRSTSFLHINSLGYHELYINGKKVTENVLSPAVSQLNKRSLIVTYDITPYIRTGKNDLVLWLGKGWYKETTFGAAYNGPLVKAQLDVQENGRWKTLLNTDTSWKGRPTGYNDTDTWRPHKFGGERIVRKNVPTDLSSSALDNMKWYATTEIDVPDIIATPMMTDGDKIQKIFTPKNITKLEDGIWLIDMGKALTGWFEIHLPRLPAGHEVKIEYTDYIDKGVFQDQEQADYYIAAGSGDEYFCNKFNHHAFQYIKISSLPVQPQKEDIKAHLIHTDYNTASSFECSDSDLNAIHDMIQYTMQCLTFGGYMVDCPHFERLGYGGDGNSSTEAFQTMYDVSPLYTNWMQAWGDVMREDGSLPHVAPNPYSAGGGPYWCGFVIMAPWHTYVNYNDSRLLERHYPLMKEWLKYVEKHTVDGLLKPWPNTDYRNWYLGDWIAPKGVDVSDESSVTLVNNCFISECYATMEKIAILLGEKDDAKLYASKRKDLNQLIHSTFYNSQKGTYATSSQLDLTYPMLAEVTPPAVYETVKNSLFKETIEKMNGHIGVGLVGVPILTRWATENKAADFIYTMLKKRDYPGYLYMIDNGASTTWEYWSAERSRIHNCYNGIGTWFYQAVGGIRIDEDNPGYKHVYIEPQIPTGVTWAKTTKESPYGTIAVNWHLESGILNIEVILPPGTKGTVILPDNTKEYQLNGKKYQPVKSTLVNNGVNRFSISLKNN